MAVARSIGDKRPQRAAMAHPLLHRALADDLLLDPLKHAARELGYALRQLHDNGDETRSN
jgi:hypothetical protein